MPAAVAGVAAAATAAEAAVPVAEVVTGVVVVAPAAGVVTGAAVVAPAAGVVAGVRAAAEEPDGADRTPADRRDCFSLERSRSSVPPNLRPA